MMVLSPFSGIFIDKFASRKWPLVIGLVAQIVATWLTAAATNSKSLLSVQACRYAHSCNVTTSTFTNLL